MNKYEDEQDIHSVKETHSLMEEMHVWHIVSNYGKQFIYLFLNRMGTLHSHLTE